MTYEQDLEKRNEELEELVSELYKDVSELENKAYLRGSVIVSLTQVFDIMEKDANQMNTGELRETVLDAVHRFKMLVGVDKDTKRIIVYDRQKWPRPEDADVITEGWEWGDKESDLARWEREYEDGY
jgi:hypothetical protein